MIEVTLMLHDSKELTHVHALVQKLEDRRREYARERWEESIAEPVTTKHAEEIVTAGDSYETRTRHFAEEPVVVKTETITPAAMETALRAFLVKHDVPAALALLKEFGAVRIGDVPAERLAELAARLQA